MRVHTDLTCAVVLAFFKKAMIHTLVLVVNYIDYDHQTTLPQDVTLSVTCDEKYQLQVVCDNTVVLSKKPICEKPGTYTHTIRIPSGHTRCEFQFFDAEGKRMVTRRIIRIKQIDTNINIQNLHPSTFLANTFIMSGDYDVNQIVRSDFSYGGISMVLYYSVMGVITMVNNSNKPATASFCVGGECIPMFVQYSGNKLRLGFAINLNESLARYPFDRELLYTDYLKLFYTHDYGYIANLIGWVNEVYAKLYDERVLGVTRKVKCSVREYLMYKSRNIATIYTDGNLVSNNNIITGSGMAILRLNIPIENKLYVFLNNNTVTLNVVYYVGVGIPICEQEMEPLQAR